MWLAVVLGILVLFGLWINSMIKKTNAYKNFYRAIHVLKDVPPEEKYDIAAFGSTFSYYAFDLKQYNGHNFSIEPQGMIYLKKTVHHFIGNVKKGGTVVITLPGCIFGTENIVQDEKCLTYQAFLHPDEFENYDKMNKIKYYLTRYFPICNPNLLKCLRKDRMFNYGIEIGIEEIRAMDLAKVRVDGWKRILGISGTENIVLPEQTKNICKNMCNVLDEVIEEIQEHSCTPVLLLLPMSVAFHKICSKEFFDVMLYDNLATLKAKDVRVLDYVYDEELMKRENYWTADCLNVKGRRILTQRMMEDLER